MAFVPYAEGKAIGFGSGLPRAIHAQHMHEQARQAAAQAAAAANAQGEAASSVAAAATAALQHPRAEQGYTTRPNLVRQLTGGLQALCTRIVTAAAAAEAQQRATHNAQRRSGGNTTTAAAAGGATTQRGSYQQPPGGGADPAAAASSTAAAAAASPLNAAEWTRSDGFLRLSPTLPLLNYRYRVLSLVGEGTFSQLAVAEDTFAPSPPSQHHLAGMYGCATCSDGVPVASAAAAAAAGRPNLIPRHRLVALKIMNSKYAFIGVQELDKLFTLNQRDQRSWCPIVRVQGPGAFYFHTHLVLVLELLGPALLSYMKNLPRGRVPVDQLRKIALQLVLALGYVSTAGMIHGDIKPENCLLEPRGRGVKVKLIDFGNAMTLHEAQAYYEDFEVQTLYYRAPEVVLGVKFNQQIDMWSLGCLLVELATGKPMFSSLNNTQLFQGMQRILGPANPAPFVAGRFFKMHFSAAQQTQAAEAAAAVAAGGAAAAAAAVLHNETQLIRITNIARLLHSKDADFVSFVHGLLEYDPAKRLSSHKALLHPFLSYLFPLSVILGEPRPLLTVALPLALPQPTGTPPMRSIARAEARRQAEEHRKRAHQAQQLLAAQQAHQQQLLAQKKQQQSPYLHSGPVPPSSLSLLSSNMAPSAAQASHAHGAYYPTGATYSPHSSPPSPYLQQQQQQQQQAAKEEAIKLQQSILALGQQLAQHQQANAQAMQMQQMMASNAAAAAAAAAASSPSWQQLGPAALQQHQHQQAHLQQQQQMHLMQQNQQQQQQLQQQHHTQQLQQRRMSHSYAADAGTLYSQQQMSQQQPQQPQQHHPQMEDVSTPSSSGGNRRRKLDAAAPAATTAAAPAAPASSPNGNSSSTLPPKAKKARAGSAAGASPFSPGASSSEAMSSPSTAAATPPTTTAAATSNWGGMWSNMSTPLMIGATVGATVGAAAAAGSTSSPPRHSPDSNSSNGHQRSPVPSASKRSASRGSNRGAVRGSPSASQSHMLTDDLTEEGNGRDEDEGGASPDEYSSTMVPRRAPSSLKANSRNTTPTHSARVLQLSASSSLDKLAPLSPRARLGLAPLSGAGGGFHHPAPSSAAPNGRSSTPRDRSASLTERRLHRESPTPSPIDFTARQALVEQQAARGLDSTSARHSAAYSSSFLQQDDAEDAAMLSRDDRPRGPSSRALDRSSSAAAAAGLVRPSSLSSLSSPKFSSPASTSSTATPSSSSSAASPRGPSSRAKQQSTLASLPMRQ